MSPTIVFPGSLSKNAFPSCISSLVIFVENGVFAASRLASVALTVPVTSEIASNLSFVMDSDLAYFLPASVPSFIFVTINITAAAIAVITPTAIAIGGGSMLSAIAIPAIAETGPAICCACSPTFPGINDAPTARLETAIAAPIVLPGVIPLRCFCSPPSLATAICCIARFARLVSAALYPPATRLGFFARCSAAFAIVFSAFTCLVLAFETSLVFFETSFSSFACPLFSFATSVFAATVSSYVLCAFLICAGVAMLAAKVFGSFASCSLSCLCLANCAAPAAAELTPKFSETCPTLGFFLATRAPLSKSLPIARKAFPCITICSLERLTFLLMFLRIAAISFSDAPVFFKYST